MTNFSVLILTAPPAAGLEAGGAYVKIDGRESLLRAVELFLNRDSIKQIQLVVLPAAIEETKRKHGGHLGFSGVKLLAAGPRWIDQIAAAREKILPDCTHVIVHDAARPSVPYTDLEAVLSRATEHPAMALAAPLRGTLIEVDEAGGAMAFLPPERFMQLLTPQIFSRERFLQMASEGKEVHASEFRLIKASPLNVRVGSSADAAIVKSMLNMLPRPKLKVADNPFEEAQW